MKVAVCLFGHLRTWKHVKPTFIRAFASQDIDLFVRVYSTTTLESSRYKPHHIHEDKSLRLPVGDIDELFEGLHVVDKVVEDNVAVGLEVVDHLNRKNVPLTLPDVVNLSSQVRMRQYVDKQRRDYEEKHGFKYDIVINARCDLWYIDEDAIHWDILEEPTDHFHSTTTVAGMPVHDLFIAGSSDVMTRVFCDIYDNIDKGHNMHKILKGRGVPLGKSCGTPQICRSYKDGVFYIEWHGAKGHNIVEPHYGNTPEQRIRNKLPRGHYNFIK